MGTGNRNCSELLYLYIFKRLRFRLILKLLCLHVSDVKIVLRPILGGSDVFQALIASCRLPDFAANLAF